MKIIVKRGKTSKLARILVADSSSTTGSGLTGLAFNTASLVAYYIREGDASPTAITLATMTVGTWATGGFKEIDATNMPGLYEVGLPNACFASGESVAIIFKGAANMVPAALEYEIDSFDPQSASAGVVPALQATALTLHPTAGTIDHALTLIWALVRGKRANVGNTQDLYSTDGATKLVTTTYTPSIAAPTGSTAVDD